MKKIKFVVLPLIALCTVILFQNCAGGSGTTSQSPDQNSDIPGGTSNPIQAASVHIVNNGKKIAYVLGIESNVATIYIPSVDRYTRVDLTTGKYQKTWVYYSGPDCTGIAVTAGRTFPGETGKSVVFFGGRYYRITGQYPGQFSYRSMFNEYDYPYPSAPEGCSNYASSQPYPVTTFVFEEVSRPYDFESIAPLKVQFN